MAAISIDSDEIGSANFQPVSVRRILPVSRKSTVIAIGISSILFGIAHPPPRLFFLVACTKFQRSLVVGDLVQRIRRPSLCYLVSSCRHRRGNSCSLWNGLGLARPVAVGLNGKRSTHGYSQSL
jgi:hypothetical protein